MTMAARIICSIPIATWLFAKNAGTGQFHMVWPMEKYIRTRRNTIEERSLFLSFGVSWSSRAASSETWLTEDSLPFSDAPYPASCTALIMALLSAVPSTPMELVRRLTEHEVTPGTPETAFSTLAEQAAQLIPVTLYCFI